MKRLLFSSVILMVSVLYLPAAFALNQEAEAILDMLYEQGRAASKEELMGMLVAIAKDESLERKKKVKEMNFVIHLAGGRLSEEEKRVARRAAFKAVDRARAEAFLARHPEIDDKRRKIIREGRLEKGMSKEEVIASLGSPEEIKKVLRRSEFDERWNYYTKRLFIYFGGGRLRAWADSGS